MPQGSIGRRTAGLRAFFTKDLWSRELATMPTFSRFGYGVARVVQLTILNFIKDRCTWRASALTYITVLSLVPMLALGFSVAKGLGAYETLLDKTIVPFLDSTFGSAEGPPLIPLDEEIAAVDGSEPLDQDPAGEVPADSAPADPALTDPAAADPAAADAPPGDVEPADSGASDQDLLDGGQVASGAEVETEATGSEVRRAIDTVLGFVQSTDVSRLGVLGLMIVVFTVIKLLGAVELSFNDIWGVRKSRSIPRKIADYLSTIVLVPLLLVTGTGVMSLARNERFGSILGAGSDSPAVAVLSSLVVVWLGFAFAYILMPNTRTHVLSAVVGGIVGGTMWQLFQWAHLKLQIGVANYNAIYSTFAALPIFLFWVQSSWMTVLLGAEAAAAHQNHARHGQIVRSRDFDLALKEVVALRLAVRVTRAFMAGAPPLRVDELAEDLGCPERTLEEVARGLERGRVIATVDPDSDGEDPALILAADPGRIRVQDVLDALKGDSLEELRGDFLLAGDATDAATDRAFARFREERDRTSANLTLRELVLDVRPDAAPGAEPEAAHPEDADARQAGTSLPRVS